MFYMLGISMEFYRYRHDAIVRVFADDHFVDEFSLDDHIRLKTVDTREMPYHGKYKDVDTSDYCRVTIVPEKFFSFRIDEQYLNKSIRIEVKNRNNNYTNGFMTDFSFVKFHSVFLVSESLLDTHSWDRLSRFDRWCSGMEYFPRVPTDAELVLDDKSSSWEENAVSSTLEKNPRLFGYKRGGSFSIDIPLSKKHKAIHLGRLRPGRLFLDRQVERLLWIYNLLNISNEDQRSNYP